MLPVTTVPAPVEAPDLEVTQWFHADCLATYYGVETWSEEHWEAIGRQMRSAARMGSTMLLTPVWTPPLDTERGANRPRTQLLDIELVDGRYSFGHARLDRWMELAAAAGLSQVEVPHLFTQWGATAAPQVWVRVDGEDRQLFGWHTDARPAMGPPPPPWPRSWRDAEWWTPCPIPSSRTSCRSPWWPPTPSAPSGTRASNPAGSTTASRRAGASPTGSSPRRESAHGPSAGSCTRLAPSDSCTGDSTSTTPSCRDGPSTRSTTRARGEDSSVAIPSSSTRGRATSPSSHSGTASSRRRWETWLPHSGRRS